MYSKLYFIQGFLTAYKGSVMIFNGTNPLCPIKSKTIITLAVEHLFGMIPCNTEPVRANILVLKFYKSQIIKFYFREFIAEKMKKFSTSKTVKDIFKCLAGEL